MSEEVQGFHPLALKTKPSKNICSCMCIKYAWRTLMDVNGEQYWEDLKTIHSRRLRLLELQAAHYGKNTPPEITMEIVDIKETLREINHTLERFAVTTYDNDEEVESISEAEVIGISARE